jgi:hypothetical protein
MGSSYSIQKTALTAGSVDATRFQVMSSTNGGATRKALTFRELFDLLIDPASGLRGAIASTLSAEFSTPDTAYFFECPAVSIHTLDKEFEFVLIPSAALARASADPTPFNEYLKGEHHHTATHFYNKGGDATLVVPHFQKDESGKKLRYAHLAEFVRNAPRKQVEELFGHMAEVAKARLEKKYNNGESLWISTSGLGVYWLHIRLDEIPKYYNWEPYKKPAEQLE